MKEELVEILTALMVECIAIGMGKIKEDEHLETISHRADKILQLVEQTIDGAEDEIADRVLEYSIRNTLPLYTATQAILQTIKNKVRS